MPTKRKVSNAEKEKCGFGFQPLVSAALRKDATTTFRVRHNHIDTFRRGFQPNPALWNRGLIEADLVDCMVALPGQLFMATEKFKVALAD